MTILSKLLTLDWGGALKDTGNFLKDNPLAEAIAVGAAGWFAAPAIAGLFAPAAPLAGTIASTVPSLQTAATIKAAADAASIVAAAEAAATKKMMLGTGINVLGGYLTSKGASSDAKQLAEENRTFAGDQEARRRADARISFVPQNRGVLARSRGLPTVGNRVPQRSPIMSSTPEQMLALRKSGVI